MKIETMNIRTKRVYDKPARNGGYRILVDRVWPRGRKKEDAELDSWMKEIAPSKELRKWFNHDPNKWDEFKKRYADELDQKEQMIKELLEKAGEKTVTLLYGAKDEEHNNAVALKDYLESRNT